MESTGRATRQVPESEAARKKASQISGRLESWKKILCYDDSDLVSTGWNLSGVGKNLGLETATRIKSLLLRWKIFKRASCDTRYNSRYSQNASLMLGVLLSATAKHYWRELARTNCKENGVSPRFANNPLIRFALRVSDVSASPHWDSLATQRISRFFERFVRKGVLVTWPLSKAGASRYSMLSPPLHPFM